VEAMSKKRRGNSRYYLLFVSIAIAIFFSGKGLALLLNKVDIFKINRIEISGNVNLETEFLEKLVTDFYGQNLYAISRQNVLERYANIVRIKDTKVRRSFPDRLKIEITERLGKYLAKTTEGNLIAVDEQLSILDSDNFYKYDILPIVHTSLSIDSLQVGSQISNPDFLLITELFSNLEKCDEGFTSKISELYLDEDEVVIVAASTGHKILFGKGDLEDKLERYTFLESNNGFDSDSIIDLRFKDRLVLKSEVR